MPRRCPECRLVLPLWAVLAAIGPAFSSLAAAEPTFPTLGDKETVAAYAARAGLKAERTADLGGGTKLEAVLIPAGEFLMGARTDEALHIEALDFANELPQHPVKIPRPFYLGKYEVTQAQWLAAIGKAPRFRGTLEAEKQPREFGTHPVEDVTASECGEFCRVLSARLGRTVRLPSEAEWEYACRAGTRTIFYFGDAHQRALPNGTHEFVLRDHLDLDAKRPMPVGRRKPNPWGLFDLYGNVAERTADPAHANYVGAPTDGSVWTAAGNADTTVVRGGSWEQPGPFHCRSAARPDALSVHLHTPWLGFRVVLACDDPIAK